MAIDFNPEEPQDFEASQLWPFNPEPGLDDPNRVTLMDTFGQEGLVEGTKKLVKMVTPQSMWSGQQSPGMALSDFVEFSPIGDIRDLTASLDFGNNMDPLERGLGIVSVLPLLGASFAGSMAVTQNTRAWMAGRKASSNYVSVGGMSLADVTSAADYRMIQQGADLDAEVTSNLSPEQRAAFLDELMKNKAIRDALDSGNDSIVATSSVYEMAEILQTGDVDIESGVSLLLASNIRNLGETLVTEMPDIFDRPNPDGSNRTRADAALHAAQIAMLTYGNLADAGILFETLEGVPGPGTVRALGGNWKNRAAGPGQGPHEFLRILGTVKALAQMNIGPNLAPSPQFFLDAVVMPASTPDMTLGNPAGDSVQVILASSQIRRTRLTTVDGRILNQRFMEDLMYGVDPRTMQPDMAANHIESMDWADANYTPAEIERAEQWYFRANNTAVSLALAAKVPLGQVAALMSGMSMRSAWAPDNVVASTHVLLRFAKPDLAPVLADGTVNPEYMNLFVTAMKAGAWEYDLLKESAKPLKERFANDMDGLLHHYGDIRNMVTKKGDKLRGMAMGSHQKNAIYSILYQVEPDMIVRMGKVNNFYTTIMDPSNRTSVTIDVHANSGLIGFDIDALGSRGTRRITITELSEGTYQFPSGNTFDLAMLERGRKALIEGGLTPAEADVALNKMKSIPNKGAEAFYRAQQESILLAAQVRGLEYAHMAQSKGWHPVQQARKFVSDQMKIHKKKGLAADSKEVQATLALRTRNRSLLDQFEGNPRLLKSMPTMTANASSDLSSVIPMAVLQHTREGGKSKRDQASPIIVAGRPDNTVEVWADLDDVAAMSEIRHLEPVLGVELNGYTRMVPRTPQQVPSTPDHAKMLAELGDGELRTYPSGIDPSTLPGDVYVFEFNDPDVANRFAERAMSMSNKTTGVVPLRAHQQQISTGVSSKGQIPNDRFDETSRAALADPSTSPFVTQDWAIIAADQNSQQSGITDPGALEVYNRARRSELRNELVSAVQRQFKVDRATAQAMVRLQQGRYGDTPEPSFLVFGLSYGTVAEIGKRFNQESVATRNGMLYTTGENAGMYNPVRGTESWTLGATGQMANMSVTPHQSGGFGWSADYDFDSLLPMGHPDGLMGRHVVGSQPRTQVIIQVESPDGWAPWQLTDRLWALGVKRSQGATAYVAGDLHRPRNTVAVEEHSFSDGVSTGVWRTGAGSGSSKAAVAWVPPEQSTVGKPTGQEFVAKRSKAYARRAVLADVEAAKHGSGVQVGNVRVKIVNTLGTLTKTSRGLLDMGMDFYRPDGTKVSSFKRVQAAVDLNGPAPTIFLGIPGSTEVGPRPGVVIVDVRDGKAVIESDDPNLFVPAAHAVAQLGYEVEAAVTLGYTAPKLDKSVPHVGTAGMSQLGRPSYDVLVTLSDRQLSDKFEALTGEPVVFSTGEAIDPVAAARLFDVVTGVTNPHGAPDFLKPLHDAGLTVAPHVIGRRGLVGGIHVADASVLSDSVHGFTVTQGDFRSRAIIVSARIAQGDSRASDGFMARMYRTRAGRHFVPTQGVSHSQYVLLHEIGHAIMGYTQYAEMLWHNPGDISLPREVTGLKRELGNFGTVTNVSNYATKHPHEFFAESFVKVATGTNVSPAIRQIVADVIRLANETKPPEG